LDVFALTGRFLCPAHYWLNYLLVRFYYSKKLRSVNFWKYQTPTKIDRKSYSKHISFGCLCIDWSLPLPWFLRNPSGFVDDCIGSIDWCYINAAWSGKWHVWVQELNWMVLFSPLLAKLFIGQILLLKKINVFKFLKITLPPKLIAKATQNTFVS
jgi:hypothetical protein